MISKLALFVKSYQHGLFVAFCVILVAFISYNIGIIEAGSGKPINIRDSGKANIYETTAAVSKEDGVSIISPTPALDMRVVASKNSDKYHYSWCSSWQRIKAENQVWFSSEQEAISKGYTLAGNCKK